jgi:hypothetical protein
MTLTPQPYLIKWRRCTVYSTTYPETMEQQKTVATSVRNIIYPQKYMVIFLDSGKSSTWTAWKVDKKHWKEYAHSGLSTTNFQWFVRTSKKCLQFCNTHIAAVQWISLSKYRIILVYIFFKFALEQNTNFFENRFTVRYLWHSHFLWVWFKQMWRHCREKEHQALKCSNSSHCSLFDCWHVSFHIWH